MIPADKRIERLTQVARMYYEQNMNQSEIAKAIGVSRPLVSVLLAEARECGIVTITINSVESARELLARRLEARFGLRLAEVVEDCLLYTSFRHTHFGGKQVVVHNRLPDLHEVFSYNLYPGPSAKKGIYSVLLDIGEQEGLSLIHI